MGKLAEPGETGSWGLSLGADGEDMATLCPPLRQDFPAARAFHAGTESMHFGATAPVRLKRSLGHGADAAGARFPHCSRGRPPGSSHRELCRKNLQFISRLEGGQTGGSIKPRLAPFHSSQQPLASGPSSPSSWRQAGHAPEEAASTGPAIARKPGEAPAAASPSAPSRS